MKDHIEGIDSDLNEKKDRFDSFSGAAIIWSNFLKKNDLRVVYLSISMDFSRLDLEGVARELLIPYRSYF